MLDPRLLSLSVAERLQLAEELWESVEKEGVLSLTAEQEAEVQRRWKAFQEEPSAVLSWEEASRRLLEER